MGNTRTAHPEEVPEKMEELIRQWESLASPMLEDLAEFHAQYEIIHPFQDGNGRIGRILLFKECLRKGLDPFIIKDQDKAEYYKALRAASNAESPDFKQLTLLFQKAQSDYRELAKPFVVPQNQLDQIRD